MRRVDGMATPPQPLRRPQPRSPTWLALRLLGVLLLVASLEFTVAAPARASDTTLTFLGHGWGHGRGMGQYGAYGYAVDHGWGYTQILSHFYGGTTLAGDAGNPGVSVEITRLTGKDTIATAPSLTLNGAPAGTPAVLVHRAGPAAFDVYYGPGCGGPWTHNTTRTTGPTIGSAADPSQVANLVRSCETSGTVAYRGTLKAVEAGGTPYTVNLLPVEDYLRAVVPRESPASWGTAGGGRGMEALRAQSVAARSYVLSGSIRASGATTCDTATCQVYAGAASWSTTGVQTAFEATTTDSAVAQTAGQVMRHTSGAIARTEFSSSTGGYSAGGVFPAVEDAGDSTTSNPNHTWITSLAATDVASRLGVADIRSIQVTARNGLGAEGGRVTAVVVQTSAGETRSFTGSAVRSALGLKSDWFSVSGVTETAARSVVRALYHDILGREVDPTGLATWTSEITRTGGASTTAAALALSRERLQLIVTEQYEAALGRGPDPEGLAYWIHLFEMGWNVPDLQAGIYGSDEAVARLGAGDPCRWIAAIYRDVLNRGAATSESEWWVNYAQSHGRLAAVTGITRSEEAALLRLRTYYATMLGREPDPAGISTFIPVLMHARGYLSLAASIGESPEYCNLAQTRFP